VKAKGVLTLTMNPSVDLSTSVDRVVPGPKLRCTPLRVDPGGGGINVSRVVARLGGETIAVHTGGEQQGRELSLALEREGIRELAVAVRARTRRSFAVIESETGNQYRFVPPGRDLQPSEWTRCLEALEEGLDEVGLVVASGSLPGGVPDDFYGRVARRCRDRGVPMILDTSGEPLRSAIDTGGIFLLKPNMAELSALYGEEIRTEEQQEEAATRLIGHYRVGAVVVSLGAGGVLLCTEDGLERLRAPSVPQRSKVGAGDSMVGGIAVKVAAGASIREAVLYGLAAGSAAVMTPGTELCRREDVDILYRRLAGNRHDESSR
jgi:6-phosphofructokinase 2